VIYGGEIGAVVVRLTGVDRWVAGVRTRCMDTPFIGARLKEAKKWWLGERGARVRWTLRQWPLARARDSRGEV
jgi:hypothetical protein